MYAQLQNMAKKQVSSGARCTKIDPVLNSFSSDYGKTDKQAHNALWVKWDTWQKWKKWLTKQFHLVAHYFSSLKPLFFKLIIACGYL